MKQACAIALAVLLLLGTMGCAGPKNWTEDEIQAKVQQAEDFITLLENGDYAAAAAQFNDDMKSALPENTLKTQWESVHAGYGILTAHLSSTAEQADGYLRIMLLTKFDFATVNISVVFDQDDLVAGFYISEANNVDDGQTLPDGVVEENASVISGDFVLPGKLTLPKEGENFAAVVIVHGSGPMDMDGSLYNLKPYRDIAWALAKQGIAVLRYDKRTLAYQDSLATDENITVYEETVEDAVSAVDLLRRDSRIDGSRIYVLGHSMGGMVLPRIQQLAQANGLIFLAASARSLEDQYQRQMQYLVALAVEGGAISQEEADATLSEVNTQVDNIRNLTAGSTLTQDDLLGVPKAYWLDLKDYDPVQMARDIEVPMLFLQGERDYQVTMDDFALWQTLLDKPNTACQSFATLGHLFIPGSETPSAEDYKTEYIPFDQEAIDAMAAFIQR